MARRSTFIAVIFLGACGQATPPQRPETHAKADAPAKAEAPAKAQAPRAVQTEPKPPAPPKPETPSPVTSAPSSPRAPASPAKPSAQAAQPTPPARPAPAKPAAPAVAAPETPRAAAAPLDLKSLEARLKDTGAIGVLTKLSLKNQVDDLIDRFLAFHDGKRPPTLGELRPAFELLLMKVLSLLQDKDTALARDINASREAIWALLNDGQRLAQYK